MEKDRTHHARSLRHAVAHGGLSITHGGLSITHGGLSITHGGRGHHRLSIAHGLSHGLTIAHRGTHGHLGPRGRRKVVVHILTQMTHMCLSPKS